MCRTTRFLCNNTDSSLVFLPAKMVSFHQPGSFTVAVPCPQNRNPGYQTIAPEQALSAEDWKTPLTGADPFSIITVVVAPAVLTNASSVLALGTNNRLARVADRSHAVSAELAKLDAGTTSYDVSAAELATLQTRAQLLLQALRCFYLGLGLFASSALIAIAGSMTAYYDRVVGFQIAVGICFACGASAVIALACGCVRMIRETQLAVKSLAGK